MTPRGYLLMSLSIGIVGLPNVGKSTLFNALVKNAQAEAKNFPFTTIDPNVGIVPVPDQRLTKIAKVENSQRVVQATVEFTDIAGIIAGAHKGEGLGNQFLRHIREVDAICLVTRVFENADTIHVEGNIDPHRDTQTILSELALADLQTLDKIRLRFESQSKNPGDDGKDAKKTLELVGRIETALNSGKMASSVSFDEDDQELIKRNLPLLTTKPLMLVFNVGENDAGVNPDDLMEKYKLAELLPSGTPAVAISAKIESELATLNNDDKKEFLDSLGLKEPGLDRLIGTAYKLLGLITFLTAGEQEARAWTCKKGATAPEAAGVIHTDFQKNFIRAEVVAYDDFIAFDGWSGSGAAGKMHLEGKDYIVRDGDVMFFRHS